MKIIIIFTPSKSIASFFVSSEANLPKNTDLEITSFSKVPLNYTLRWNKKMKQIVIRGNYLANLLIQ